MSFDFSTLVTDRSQADVDRIRELIAKGWAPMTPEEQQAFNAATSKGSYNYTDLNRVTACMEYLNEQLNGYGYETEYKKIEIPHQQGPISPLPNGYTLLEYIESSGTQCIDTGFKPNQDTRVVMDAEVLPSQTTEGHLFSVTDSAFFTMFVAPAQPTWYRGRYANQAVKAFPASCNGYNRYLFDKNKNTVTIGEEVISFNAATFQMANNLPLLCRNASGTYNTFVSARLYSCQIYDDGEQIRNFLPCANQSGSVGLYDVANNTFYGNAGTGIFSAGPEVPFPEPKDQYTWYETDLPTVSLMEAYLDNIQAIRSALELLSTTPPTPESMEALTWAEANNIEQILVDVETVINRVVNGMARSNSFTFWSGNRPFPTAESNLGRTWAELDAMNTEWKNWQVATWYLLLYGNLEAEGEVS